MDSKNFGVARFVCCMRSRARSYLIPMTKEESISEGESSPLFQPKKL